MIFDGIFKQKGRKNVPIFYDTKLKDKGQQEIQKTSFLLAYCGQKSIIITNVERCLMADPKASILPSGTLKWQK